MNKSLVSLSFDAMWAQLQSLRYYDSLGWEYGIAYAQNNIARLFEDRSGIILNMKDDGKGFDTRLV